MSVNTVTLNLPEMMYRRLLQTAQATQRSLDEVVLHALQVGSPPAWNDAPAEFQADLAALDRLDDEALWRIARSSRSEADMRRYQELLDRHANSAQDVRDGSFEGISLSSHRAFDYRTTRG